MMGEQLIPTFRWWHLSAADYTPCSNHRVFLLVSELLESFVHWPASFFLGGGGGRRTGRNGRMVHNCTWPNRICEEWRRARCTEKGCWSAYYWGIVTHIYIPLGGPFSVLRCCHGYRARKSQIRPRLKSCHLVLLFHWLRIMAFMYASPGRMEMITSFQQESAHQHNTQS